MGHMQCAVQKCKHVAPNCNTCSATSTISYTGEEYNVYARRQHSLCQLCHLYRQRYIRGMHCFHHNYNTTSRLEASVYNNLLAMMALNVCPHVLNYHTTVSQENESLFMLLHNMLKYPPSGAWAPRKVFT